VIRPRLLLSLVAGTVAFAGALVITEPLGPGLDPDWMAYLHAATSLVERGSLRDVRDDWMPADSERALTRWPPGFPIAIAAPVAAGAPAIQSARFIIALSAFAMLAIITWLVSGIVSVAAAGVLAALLLVSPAIAYVHESVLSEPLFLVLIATTLALMARERAAPLAEGCAAAAASMVRYAGLAAVGTVVLWELARSGPWRARAKNAALAALPALLVNAWWWTRAARVGGRSAVRHFTLYGALSNTVTEGIATTTAWLAPRDSIAARWIALAVAAALIVVTVRGVRRALAGEAPREGRLLAATALLTIDYLGLVIVARIFADAEIPLDQRLLAPAILLVTLFIVVAGSLWWRGASRAGRVIAAAALVVWSIASMLDTRDAARYVLATGSDYADQCWRGSPVVAWVREHGGGHPLISNASVALYFHAGRLAREMPDDPSPKLARAMADTIAARDAYLVLFDQSCAATIESGDSLVKALGLAPVAQLRTGSIWGAARDTMHEPPAPVKAPAVRRTL